MAKLSDICGGMTLDADPKVRGLTADSRQVAAGFVFAALPGARADGRDYIAQALERGAVAVIAPDGTAAPADVPLLASAEPRRLFARMAARFHKRQPRTIAAVTGTNGKTSVASFARQIWSHLGRQAASIGTLGVVSPLGESGFGLTTPDPVVLHRTLAELARGGVTHVCLEASSHGLDQYRLDGVALKAAGFTNLTRDHLDYHADMEAYAAAKLRLFGELLPEGGTAVINADSDWAGRFIAAAEARGLTVMTYGAAGHDIHLVERVARADGQTLRLVVRGRPYEVFLPLVGGFQAANAMCALGLVLACRPKGKGRTREAVQALAHLRGVPGRLQPVARYHGAPILVDYAHTPDALATVLAALRPHVGGRLVAVFGAGGDRDPGKRPLMGQVVAELADAAIVTDDNPRGEDPAAIRAQILAACPKAREIGDRAKAIATAIAGLDAGDVLVVAGKGHEQGQTVAGVVHPFDDATVCRQAVEALEGER